jgi:hypothetical protein
METLPQPQAIQPGGGPDRRLSSTKAYLKHTAEVSLGPVLMSLGVVLALTSYVIRSLRTLSVDIALLGLVLAMVGSALEMAFLVIVSRAVDVIAGRKYSLTLKIIGIAAMMTAYMTIIGMPIVGAYLGVLMSRLRDAAQGSSLSLRAPKSELFWLYSLLSFGFFLAFAQASFASSLIAVIDSLTPR